MDDLEKIKEIVAVFGEAEISEMNLEIEGLKIGLKKDAKPRPSLPKKEILEPEEEEEEEDIETFSEAKTIIAPMIGTFYRAPAPGAEPFVEEGDRVEPDTVVGIVEAMKSMNRVEACISGRITRILVENEEPVEYGQSLFLVEPE